MHAATCCARGLHSHSRAPLSQPIRGACTTSTCCCTAHMCLLQYTATPPHKQTKPTQRAKPAGYDHAAMLSSQHGEAGTALVTDHSTASRFRSHTILWLMYPAPARESTSTSHHPHTHPSQVGTARQAGGHQSPAARSIHRTLVHCRPQQAGTQARRAQRTQQAHVCARSNQAEQHVPPNAFHDESTH